MSSSTDEETGCGWYILVMLGVMALSIFACQYHRKSEKEKEHQIAINKQKVHQNYVKSETSLTIKKLQLQSIQTNTNSQDKIDIDKTIRTIHEMDKLLENNKNFIKYIKSLEKQDYTNVAPDLLAARANLIETLIKIYSSQTDIEDQKSISKIHTQIALKLISSINIDANFKGAAATISFDKSKSKEIENILKSEQNEQTKLYKTLRTFENELLENSLQYGTLYAKYITAWDNLCVLRDRAYLASHEHDWARAEEAAAQAMTLAPQETEAHLLRAMALIEQARSNPEAADTIAPARAILADYIKAHPERSAPALLLEGVALGYAGDQAGAKLALQQAAAYYPRQAEHLQDMLNPYRMREFLRKSREGNFIIEQYKATMLGAGYFSPDLQLARLHFEAGDHDAGHAKLLDHFSRRRAQGQWDFILSDLAFCERTMGPHWRRVFPQEPYLDLKVTPSLIGSELSVEVHNRSERTLRNATLVLALRFTDMHRDDYQTFTPTRTLPALLARDVTSFGDVPISATLLGQEKTTADVVQHRAILVSDEAVSWVDTDEYKLAEHKELRQQRWYQQVAARNAAGDDAAFKALGYSRDSFEQMLVQKSNLSISDELGKDSVQIAIPAPLAMLRPLFKLRRGQASFEPQLNVLDTDQIQLTFKSVANFNDSDQQAPPLDLTIDGLFGDSYTLRWAWGQTQPELIRQPR